MSTREIGKVRIIFSVAALCGAAFAVAMGAGRPAMADDAAASWMLTDKGQNPPYLCEKQVPPGNAAAGKPITSLSSVTQCKPSGDGKVRCRALYVYGNGYRYAPSTTCMPLDLVPTDKGQNPAYLCEKQVPPGNAAGGKPITSLVNVTQCQPWPDGRVQCRALYVYGNGYRYAPKTLCIPQ